MLGQLAIIAIVGGAAGFLAGLLGVGGGILMVPALLYFLHDQIPNMNVAVGTSMAIIVPVAIVGTVLHASGGRVNWTVVLAVVVFSMAGSAVGSYVSGKTSPLVLKRVFAVLLMIVAIRMFWGDKSAQPPQPERAAGAPLASVQS